MKFNLLTKYLFVYAAVALLGFLGVTFISYRIDYAKVYNYYTDALYKQALSISSEYADDYFSEEHLRIVETELRTVALLNDTRIMFIDTAGNIILDTAYTQEHNTKDILYTIDGFDYQSGDKTHADRRFLRYAWLYLFKCLRTDNQLLYDERLCGCAFRWKCDYR